MRRLGSGMRRWLAPIALVLAATAIAGPATAKVDSRQPPIATADARVSTNFGVLSGLSVFAEGRRRYDVDTFVSSGLNIFFGNTVSRGQGVQVAQDVIRRADVPDLASANSNPGS